MLKVIITFMLGLVILGCATGYHESQNDGGYSEMRISEDHYIILYSANGFSKYNVIRDYAFLRAAEVGKKLGFDYFATIRVTDKTVTKTFQNHTPVSSSGYVDNYGAVHITTTGGDSYDYDVRYPNVEMELKYFTQYPTEKYLNVYKISDVITEIRAKHNIKAKENSQETK